MATAASIGAGATCSADLGDESETQATLRASVICGDIEAVADALRSGADAALQDDSDGSSPLILAAKVHKYTHVCLHTLLMRIM